MPGVGRKFFFGGWEGRGVSRDDQGLNYMMVRCRGIITTEFTEYEQEEIKTISISFIRLNLRKTREMLYIYICLSPFSSLHLPPF